MKKLIFVVALFCFAVPSHAQNWATVSGSNITDLNQRPLAAGQICFLVTDQNDRPISVSIGGGGQTLRRPYCSAVSNGAITSFTVPNPASTSPAGIYYRVTVKDTTTGQEVLRYPLVSFSGATFNFDNYAPTNLGSFAPLSGNSVSGNLSVTGDLSVTGTFNAGSLGATSVTSLTDTGAASFAGPATLSRTVPTGPAAVMPPPSYIDGSSGTGGTGGMLEFTNEAANTTGYSAWLTQNAFWDGTNWIAPRGTGLASHGLAVSFHKNFSFNFSASPGTNNSPITWTEWANLGATGFNLETGNYLVNGSQISFSNIAGQSTCAQQPALTGDTTSAAGSCATTTSKVNGVSYAAAPATHSIPVITAANIASYKTVPNCQDTAGSHINYTQSTDTFSCGTSVPANVVTTSAAQTLTNKTIGSGGLAGLIPNHQIFASSGVFTIPGGVTAVKVTVVGGGGAGGGATTTNGSAPGGSGAGAAIKWLTGLIPGNTITVTVGSGGIGVANAQGSAGTASSISSGTQTVITVTANGGFGANPAASPNPSGGGTASNGDLNFAGSAGTGGLNTVNYGAPGGASIFGGAGSGGLASAGIAGGAPGAGGGGAGGTAAGPVAGGNGANGIVIFEWAN